jgi:hypothetical protein
MLLDRRSRSKATSVWRFAIIASVAGAITGCGGAIGETGGDSETRRRLSMIASIYGDYLAMHGNSPPASESDFVAAFTDHAPRLKALKLPESKDLLVSPRDGQPFLLAYDAKTQRAFAPWVAVERVGVGGKLLGVQGRGVIAEATPDQLPEAIRAALGK